MNAMLSVGATIRAFYEQCPFNAYPTTNEAARAVRARPTRAYKDLDALLRSTAVGSVLDIGCGTGLLTLAMATYPGVRALGLDLAQSPLDAARATARALQMADRVSFMRADLFEARISDAYDLVTSIGVLHHTQDARAAFAEVQKLVSDSGYVFLGLYHRYSRQPFHEKYRKILATEGEEACFREFAAAHNGMSTFHAWSWFRDQVLNPHESWHTLEEVIEWLERSGFALCSTSINRYQPIVHRSELFRAERSLSEVSRRKNEKGGFFPGFFTVLARRNSMV